MLSRYLPIVVLPALLFASLSVADDTVYRYEGNVFPFDESAGWEIFDPCEPPCTLSIENGRFVVRWPQPGDRISYNLRIAFSTEPQPPTFWVEWRFRSNHPLDPFFPACDAELSIRYRNASEVVILNGDAVVSFSFNDFVLGLELNEFHTLRFESLDGVDYRVSVDGQVFIEVSDTSGDLGTNLQLRAVGGCDGPDFPRVNQWDYVRHGTIAFGEQVVATDPPAGVHDANQFPSLDRFTVTFDADNFVHIDDITVEVTGGPLPIVTKTRRRETDEPDTVEIVLDRPLSAGQTTTFTLTDGVSTNIIAYTLDFDDDEDGVFNTQDNCPSHANPNQADCDSDGTGDVCTLAECTDDPACADCDLNSKPDTCDPDNDADGTINACEACPNDPEKLSPGECGCGTPDTDTDQDTIPDCNDQCPGEDDLIDRNANSVPDCLEELPIPALSTWGMVALALLLLAVARRVYGRSTSHEVRE